MKIFEKYYQYKLDNGKIGGFNPEAFDLAEESFELFKSLYDTQYGSIEEDENLVSIHTGGWSDNEELIEELRRTSWWFKFHQITICGGHYYFDTDFHGKKEWQIISKLK